MEIQLRVSDMARNDTFLQDEDQESMLMTNKNGHRFLCYLPMVEEAKTGKPIAQQNMSSMIVESDRRIKPKTPDELMEVLTEQCLLRVRT